MKYCLWTILQILGDWMYPSLCEAELFPQWLSSGPFSVSVSWVDDRNSKVTTRTSKAAVTLHPSWLLVWIRIYGADTVASWRLFSPTFRNPQINLFMPLHTPTPKVLISRKTEEGVKTNISHKLFLSHSWRDLEIYFSFIFSLSLLYVRNMACTIGAYIILWLILYPSCHSNCQYLSGMSQPQLADVWFNIYL